MRKHVVNTAALLILLSAFIAPSSSAATPELMAAYSNVVPTIDGSLGAEWNDTSHYTVNLTGAAIIETWVYLKHDGSHIYIGLLVWQWGTHSVDEFTVFFEEGDDGSHGSGTRDNALTAGQEDLKSCRFGLPLRDGFYNDSSWCALDVEIDFEANCTYETDHSTTPSEIEYREGESWVDDHRECEFAIPFVGNDGGIDDGSDLNCTIADTLGLKIQ